ncbi:threonine--tRNA ligase, partial [Patescibacteria group bacterium]|nr:threonine--tRNA ligase [Patescibacteria group bacterium]
MLEIIKKDLKFEKKEISIKEAKNLFKDQPYKLELIEKLFEKKTTIYQTSYFIDLCKGPHIKS